MMNLERFNGQLFYRVLNQVFITCDQKIEIAIYKNNPLNIS